MVNSKPRLYDVCMHVQNINLTLNEMDHIFADMVTMHSNTWKSENNKVQPVAIYVGSSKLSGK